MSCSLQASVVSKAVADTGRLDAGASPWSAEAVLEAIWDRCGGSVRKLSTIFNRAGTGQVSKADFERGLRLLGVDCEQLDGCSGVDDVFGLFDRSRRGSLALSEPLVSDAPRKMTHRSSPSLPSGLGTAALPPRGFQHRTRRRCTPLAACSAHARGYHRRYRATVPPAALPSGRLLATSLRDPRPLPKAAWRRRLRVPALPPLHCRQAAAAVARLRRAWLLALAPAPAAPAATRRKPALPVQAARAAAVRLRLPHPRR